MSKELVISSNRHETKVALIEDDLLCEVYFQRANEYSLAGSIHKGRVTRVLPGMQSAFVDLGLERDTFLYVSDFLEEHEDFDKVGDERPAREAREPRESREPREARESREPREFRDRDRERRPPQSLPPTMQAGAPGADPDAAASAPEVVSAPISTPVTAVPSGESKPEDRGGDRERRGRRSRRRRTNGRGFPDSKYATNTAEQRTAGPQSAFRQPPPPADAEVEETDSDEIGLEPAAEEITPIILPGESLRKYRDAPPIVKPAVAAEPEVEEVEAALELVEEFDEPLHYPAENAVPDAPVHEAVAHEPVAEEAVAPEPEPEPEAEVVIVEFVAAAVPPPLPEEYIAAHHAEIEAGPEAFERSADAAQEAAEEGEGGPAIAPGLDDEEDRDIQAMILGNIEGIDTLEEGGEEASAGGEPGATPEGGTASVRDRGGRFPHRGSRRNRRRRGGSWTGQSSGRRQA